MMYFWPTRGPGTGDRGPGNAQVKAVADGFEHPAADTAEKAGLLLRLGGLIRHDRRVVSLSFLLAAPSRCERACVQTRRESENNLPGWTTAYFIKG